MTTQEQNERELIALCAKNDKNARRILYSKYAAGLYALCLRYVTDEECARDLMHDAMIKVFDNVRKFHYTGEDSVQKWVRSITVHLCIDYLRKKKRLKQQLQYCDDILDSEDTADNMYDVPDKVLFDMIAALPDIQRTIFNLYYLDEYSHREIGEMLGIKGNSSSSLLTRARQTLRAKIKTYLNEKHK